MNGLLSFYLHRILFRIFVWEPKLIRSRKLGDGPAMVPSAYQALSSSRVKMENL